VTFPWKGGAEPSCLPVYLSALRVTALHREPRHFGRLGPTAGVASDVFRMISRPQRQTWRSESLDFYNESARAPPGVTPLQFPKP